MAAPKGNKYRLAIDDPEVRQKAYKSFLQHRALGKAIQSWAYDDGEYLCCYKTMLSYLEKNPEEFPAIHRNVAEAKGYQHWENITDASAAGRNPAANTASLQMVMRNKYGWDKRQDPQETVNEATVQQFSALIEQLNQLQKKPTSPSE